MSDLELILREAIGAVTLDRHGSLYWFGQRSGPPKLGRRALTRNRRVDDLRLRLQRRLYRNFYAIGAAAPMIEFEDRDEADTPAFLEELSSANCGRGVEERGWKLIAQRGATAIVTRNGLTFRVSVDRIVKNWRRHITLRQLKELRGISPGFYMAIGDVALLPEEPLIRVYWNIGSDGAASFIRHTTRLLNGASVAFRAKVLSDPLSFDRCDAAVLYVMRRDRRRVYPLIREVGRCLDQSLKALTPAFTKHVGHGVAVAEDPPGAESFGEHRCGIMAEALLHAYEKRKTTVQDRLEEVLGAFEQRGISSSAPFLNPGSDDVYPPLQS